MTGREYVLDLEARDTILTAKIALQKKTGIPPDQQRLMYHGKVLENNQHVLGDYSISTDSTFHFIPETQEPSFERQRESTITPSWPPAPPTWRSVAVDEDFDEDEYIVDPHAHFNKLRVLEQETVEGSQFYQYKGRYAPFGTQPFIGDESKDIRNIPDHLRIYLEDLSWPPPSPALRTAVDRSERKFEKWWQNERPTLAYLCRSYFIICRVLQRLELLRASRFSTYFFSILRLHEGIDVAEIVKLRVSLIENIKGGMEAAFRYIIDEIGGDSPKALLREYVEVPCTILLEDAGIMPPRSHSRNSQSILTLCHMTAHLLDLAVVSYVGSHGSPFCERFLGQDSQRVEVRGDSEDDFSFNCSMQSLACLHGFLDKRMAWVFSFYPGRQLPTQMRTPAPLSILARMQEFADIWGPVWTVPTEDGQIKQYNVSKGVICKVRSRQNEFRAVQCHWYSWTSYHRRRMSNLLSRSEDLLLAEDDLLLIGGLFQQNYNCRYTLDDYEAEYGRNMGVLGTTPSYWKADSRGLSFGLSKIAGVTVSGSQKLIPQTSVKQHILDKWTNNPTRSNPGVLNQYLGLEISDCTGNARRISLKSLLLLSTVSPLLERQIPAWTRTRWGSRFIAALRTTNIQAVFAVWKDFAQYRDQIAELVCCVLEVLNTTGRGNDHFLAGFLHDGQESSVSLDYGRNDWAEVLEDSHLTGVYAVINNVCLECRLPNHSAMTCTNSDAYTVLQTQFKVDAADDDPEYDRISVSPFRKIYQRADAGTDRISLFRPESRSFFNLSRFSALKASKIRDQCQSDLDFYLRASSRSYHGRKLPRRRRLAPTPRLVAMQEARDEPEVNAVGEVRYERRPAPLPEHAPPVILGDYDDRNRRSHRRVRRRAQSPVRHRNEAGGDYDSADEADLLHDIKNYAIEDGIADAAIWYEAPYADPRIEERPRIDGAVTGHRH